MMLNKYENLKKQLCVNILITLKEKCIFQLKIQLLQIIKSLLMNLIIILFSIDPKVAHDLSSDINPLSYVNKVVNSIVIPTITTLEVRRIISSTKNSSPGWDDIPTVIAKKCIEYYINPLTHIITNSIKEGVFPSELKLARVVQLLKLVKSQIIDIYLFCHSSKKSLRE